VRSFGHAARRIFEELTSSRCEILGTSIGSIARAIPAAIRGGVPDIPRLDVRELMRRAQQRRYGDTLRTAPFTNRLVMDAVHRQHCKSTRLSSRQVAATPSEGKWGVGFADLSGFTAFDEAGSRLMLSAVMTASSGRDGRGCTT